MQSGTLTITSTGSITSSLNAVNVFNNSVTGVINDGSITATGSPSAIANYTGTIGTLSNSGLITSVENTIFNSGTINNLSNSVSGGMSSSISSVLLNHPLSTIGTLTNSGQINSNTLSSINNYGVITDFTNNATAMVSSSSSNSIYNQSSGTITTLTNLGQITSSGANSALSNFGTITNLINNATGTMSNTGSAPAIQNSVTGTIGTLTNEGTIFGSSSYAALNNNGTITNLNNSASGTIRNPVNSHAIYNGATGIIGTLNNDGTIQSSSVATASNPYPTVFNNGSITDFTNNPTGAISSSVDNAIYNQVNKTIGTLTNYGLITSSGNVSALNNFGTITNLINNSTGTMSNTGSAPAVFNGARIETLTNNGAILSSSANQAIFNLGTITNIINSGTIASLDNLQGSSSALSFTGRLPTLYGIIINSTTNYGKLSVSNPGQSILTFGIFGNIGTFPTQDLPASVITSGTYRSVLTGLSSNNIASSSLSGTYPGGYTWRLVNAPGSTTTWDLVVMSPQIGPGSQTVNGRVGTAITNTVVLTGADFIGNVSYTIAPNLPAGLTLNNSTGVISGTPTMAQSASSYTITGTGATSGMATSTVSIEVAEIPVTENATIPTLNEWAMILLVSLMGVFGFDRQRLFKRLSFKQACQRQRRNAQR
jgi:hypothetical protein